MHAFNYYNEYDEFAAQWLRNLIAAGLIAPGYVDERSIEDVLPDDLHGFNQCHFFAGIGVWSYALRRAGWADDRPIWTASCPCQPFSAAGQGAGFADERHLWPALENLIRERRPTAVLGEQVASKAADDWIDLVCADVEALGYSFGAIPFPAASRGAPHIRDRTYWMAYANSVAGREGGENLRGRPIGSHAQPWPGSGSGIVPVGLANTHGQRSQHQHGLIADGAGSAACSARSDADSGLGGLGHPNGLGAGRHGRAVPGALDREDGQPRADDADASGGVGSLGYAQRSGLAFGQREPGVSGRAPGAEQGQAAVGAGVHVGGVADADGWHTSAERQQRGGQHGQQPQDRDAIELDQRTRPGPTNGFWGTADWIFCRDDKWRPVEPGTQPLVTGAAARVGRLRAYGNALCAEAAVAFIEVAMEVMP